MSARDLEEAVMREADRRPVVAAVVVVGGMITVAVLTVLVVWRLA